HRVQRGVAGLDTDPLRYQQRRTAVEGIRRPVTAGPVGQNLQNYSAGHIAHPVCRAEARRKHRPNLGHHSRDHHQSHRSGQRHHESAHVPEPGVHAGLPRLDWPDRPGAECVAARSAATLVRLHAAPARRTMTRCLGGLGWKTASLLVWCALLLLWQLIADAGVVPRIFLPGPDATWAALIRGLESGRMTGMLLATTERMLLGWLLASLAGIALGAVIGMSSTLRAYLEPTLEALRPLPSSAVIPVAIALFGLGDGMVYTVIGFGALWPMLLST